MIRKTEIDLKVFIHTYVCVCVCARINLKVAPVHDISFSSFTVKSNGIMSNVLLVKCKIIENHRK